MKNFLHKIRNFIVTHKKTSVAILLVVILTGYWGYKRIASSDGETRYVLAAVTNGTIMSSVAGTGQVSASNQIDIKSEVAGIVTSIGVSPGDKVFNNQLILAIDSTEAQKTLRDAEISLASAKLSLQKLKNQNSSTDLNSNLAKAYDDGFSAVSNAFVDLSTTLSELDILFDKTELSDNVARSSGNTALNYLRQAEDTFYKANNAFKKNQIDFRSLNRSSPNDEILNIISETYDTAKLTSDAVKSFRNYVDYLSSDLSSSSIYANHQTALASYASTINNHLNTLATQKNNIRDYQNAVPNASLDIQTSELSVTQKENALEDAREALAKCYIRAPLDGIIASIATNLKANIGSGTTVASIISPQKIATLSLSEVDVAKVMLGQKAALTFDAVSDLMIAGKVIEIDPVGTVSSGVVNYNVKIGFDTDDERVKPGMSVNASIITNTKQNVLVVPNSAIKTKNGSSYVEILADSPTLDINTNTAIISSGVVPQNKTVTTGISDDNNTEIISGLEKGVVIIIKTTKSSNTTKTTSTNSSRQPTASSILSGGPVGGPRN